MDADSARAVEHTWPCEYERLLEVIEAYKLEAISVEFGMLHSDPEQAIKPLEGFVGRQPDAAGVRSRGAAALAP